MRLEQEKVERSGRVAEDLKNYDSKNKGKLDAAIKEADAAVVEGKAEFDRLKLLGGPGLWEAFGEFEKLLIKRRQLSENFLKEKSKLEIELRGITRVVIESYVLDLLKEVTRINGLKRFETEIDKEDVHGNKQGARIFIAKHNYFSCHLAEKEILAGIETLKNFEFESLASIQKKYNEIVEAIPSEFPFETTEGNERLRQFFFENRPTEVNPDLISSVWMHVVKAQNDLALKDGVMSFWSPLRTPNKDREVEKLVSKHKPIVDLGNLMSRYGK